MPAADSSIAATKDAAQAVPDLLTPKHTVLLLLPLHLTTRLAQASAHQHGCCTISPPMLLTPELLLLLLLPLPDYWGWFKPARSYHHTGVVSTFYAMREALAIVGEEGLPAMWARHLAAHQLLWKGLGELGLQPYVPDAKDR